LTYTNGGNSVTESIALKDLADGSPNPHVDWTDVVTAVSGSAAFLAAFGPVGSTSIGDYIDDALPNGVTLDNIAAGLTSQIVAISSGQDIVSPAGGQVSEPSTMAIFAGSLLGFGWLYRRRNRS
jgi:hypothetical protein